MIKELLVDKTPSEKSKIKATEIAKLNHVGKFTEKEFEIEIVSLNKFEQDGQSGIEVMARAWKDGKGVGLGSDGSIEIERFKIFNPSILVLDPAGDIVYTATHPTTGATHETRLREDPMQAVREELAHAVRVTAKDDSRLVIGKIGNTTSTFNPVGGTGTAPANGRVQRGSVNETFTTVRNGAGTNAAQGETGESTGWIMAATTTTDQYSRIARPIFGFPVSIGSNVASSAVFSVWIGSGFGSPATGLGDTDVDIVRVTPNDGATFINSDYADFASTRLATGKTLSTLSTVAYSDWTLNATGLALVVNGNLYLAPLAKWDVDNSFTGTWSSTAETFFQVFFVDGGTNVPKLVVVHSVPVNSNFFMFMSPDR